MSTEAFQNLCRPSDDEALVLAVRDGLLSGCSDAHHVLLDVPVEAFTSSRARSVWTILHSLYRDGKNPDLLSIEREAHKTGQVYDLTWLDDTTRGNVEQLAEEVLNLYQRRELYKTFSRAAQDAQVLLLDRRDVAQLAVSSVLQIVSGDTTKTVNAWEAIDELLKHHHKFRESQTDDGKLVWFGLEELDSDPENGGIPAAPGHVVILAARPGLGKTALATQIMGATAEKGQKVFVISLELGRFEMLQRIAGWFTKERRGAFSQGTYTDYHVGRLKEKWDELNRVCIWDPAGPSWSRIESKIRGAVIKGFRVIVIDHFSEIDIRGLIPKGGQRREGSMECARRLKIIAKELNICIVLVSQLNREVPPGEIPGTEHLRETGELEQIAYSVLMLYHQKAKPPDTGSSLRMALVKNRDGKAGYSRGLDFNGGSCRMVTCA